MRTSVAAATVELNVTTTVVGPVCTALITSAPATSVVYAGVPLRMTAWSNVRVSTASAATALVTLIGVVGCGLFTTLLRCSFRTFRRDLSNEPGMGLPFG